MKKKVLATLLVGAMVAAAATPAEQLTAAMLRK